MGFHGIANMANDPCGVWGEVEVMVFCLGVAEVEDTQTGRLKVNTVDDVWEKCQQNYKKPNEAWHDEGYEEDEMWRSGDEKIDYDPLDEALPLGRVNGARFTAMIRKELESNKYVYEQLRRNEFSLRRNHCKALTRLNSSTWATKWFKRLVAYAKCNRDSYERDKELAERRR
ncbi:hypothetical protein Tco_0436693 [Tanacetum coccineum]